MRFSRSQRSSNKLGAEPPPADSSAEALDDEAAEATNAEAPPYADHDRTGGKATTGTDYSSQIAPGGLAQPVLVPRWIQLVILPLALLGLWALARAAGTVLLIFLAASVMAIILNPLVKRFERLLPRGLAMVAVFVAFFGVLTGIGVLLANPIGNQVDRFSGDVPHLVHQANHDLDQLQRWLNRNGIKIHIEQQGQTALQTLQKKVTASSGSIVSYSRDLLAQLVTIGFDFVLTVVLTIYLLAYARQIGDLVRRIMPDGDGTPEDDFPLMIQRAVSGYVRGQLTFSLIMGASAALGLWLLGLLGIFPAGERYALFFGAFYGLMELFPYIGPVIGAIPAVAVALFNDPISALWVTLMFVGLQQLEGHVVAPQVFRISLHINPILVILALLIGYHLYGIVGALIALPIAASIRQTVVYLRRHLVLEPWSVARPPPGLLDLSGARCPNCGASLELEDAFCSECGARAELEAEKRGVEVGKQSESS
jgi:predicted PurR-regulated permease PerM